jgi:hypothetical protein
MKLVKAALLACVAAAACVAIVQAQSSVTITLVRWPFT